MLLIFLRTPVHKEKAAFRHDLILHILHSIVNHFMELVYIQRPVLFQIFYLLEAATNSSNFLIAFPLSIVSAARLMPSSIEAAIPPQ